MRKGTDPLRAKLNDFEPHHDYPINYHVADFGMDQEIASSLESEKEASKTLNFKWELQKNEDGTYMEKNFPGPGIKNGGAIPE